MATINDTMANIRYELDDRDIYNDIRSETGLSGTETVTDSDPSYAWKKWSRSHKLPSPGVTKFRYYEAMMPNPSWSSNLSASATDMTGAPYYDYAISLIDTNEDNTKAVELKNTGSSEGWIHYTVKYKYLVTEGQTHEETTYSIMSVRVVDTVSQLQFGPRVMNLLWPEGVSENAMRAECNAKLAWHKDPVSRAYVSMKGTTHAIRELIFEAEIDDIVTIACANLGLNADFRLKELDISGGPPEDIPMSEMTFMQLRTVEGLTLFTLDSSLLDGTHVLAP